MVHFGTKRVRDALFIVGVAAAALAVVVLVQIAVHVNRPPTHDDAQANSEDEAGAAKPSGPPAVRFDRPELATAAGIEVESVQSRPVDSTVSCNGSVGFNQNKYVNIPPKADGTLLKINVDVGSKVRAGDVLAVVNSHALGDLKASYLKALVHEEHLRWQINRYEAAAEGVAAKNLFEAKHLLDEQLADTARMKNRLENFGLSPAQVDRIVREKDLSVQLPVMSPRDGVVVQRQAVEGEPVQTTTSLFAIADLGTMWIHLHVYEDHLRYVHLGQSVTFFPDGLPDQGFQGTVTWISPEIDSQTRSIQLRAEVSNRDGALRANMFGKGELLLEQPHPRLVVPQAAVQSLNGDHVVFVQKPDNVYEARRIVVGLKDDQFWEVTSGLESGEKVATTGSFLLKSNLENPDFGRKVE